MLRKIITILKSRFKQQQEDEWVKKRRETCFSCIYNSKNTQSYTLTHKFLTALSNFYTRLTGKFEEIGSLGYCTICHCDLYYKTNEQDEDCNHPEGSKWKIKNK